MNPGQTQWKKPIPTQAQIREELEKLKLKPGILCIQCGKKLRGEYYYCPYCGNGTERLFKKPSIKWVLICIICGNEINEIYAKYCSNCGLSIRREAEIK